MKDVYFGPESSYESFGRGIFVDGELVALVIEPEYEEAVLNAVDEKAKGEIE